MIKRKYITAFSGGRDGYQLVVSLYKSGCLQGFVTGIYGFKVLCFLRKFRKRRSDLFPDKKVYSNFLLEILFLLMVRLGFPRVKAFVHFDNIISWLASRKARKTKSSLFLYEFYAEYAFAQKYRHDMKKIVYYFHPHPKLDHEIHMNDCLKYPEFTEEYVKNSRTSLSEKYKNHTFDAWKKADLIVCSSSFTEKSLVYAGADPARIRIIPYGVDVNNLNNLDVYKPVDSPYFLYVGSGIHRKGLHHLIEAWEQANMPVDARLIIVARTVNPTVLKWLQKNVRGVEWVNGVSGERLKELYSQASLFVLPSLCEGFGLVYIEALSYGCPVLGTTSSCLPDIDDQSGAITFVDVANVEQLSSRIKALWQMQLHKNVELRRKSQEISKRYTWGEYYHNIQLILEEVDR